MGVSVSHTMYFTFNAHMGGRSTFFHDTICHCHFCIVGRMLGLLSNHKSLRDPASVWLDPQFAEGDVDIGNKKDEIIFPPN